MAVAAPTLSPPRPLVAAFGGQRSRTVLLAALLLAGVALRLPIETRHLAPAVWPPEADPAYDMPGWVAGPLQVEEVREPGQTSAILQRPYYRLDGDGVAWLSTYTAPQPQARMLFRKGPDRDFLGAGYDTQRLDLPRAPPLDRGGLIVARRGTEAWLIVYAYGERRGLLGDGVQGWLAAEADALFDRKNHHYLARVLVPFPADGPPPVEESAALATTLFRALEVWYAAASG